MIRSLAPFWKRISARPNRTPAGQPTPILASQPQISPTPPSVPVSISQRLPPPPSCRAGSTRGGYGWLHALEERRIAGQVPLKLDFCLISMLACVRSCFSVTSGVVVLIRCWRGDIFAGDRFVVSKHLVFLLCSRCSGEIAGALI